MPDRAVVAGAGTPPAAFRDIDAYCTRSRLRVRNGRDFTWQAERPSYDEK